MLLGAASGSRSEALRGFEVGHQLSLQNPFFYSPSKVPAVDLWVPPPSLPLDLSTQLGPDARLVSHAERFYLFLLCIFIIFVHASGGLPYKMMDAFS